MVNIANLCIRCGQVAQSFLFGSSTMVHVHVLHMLFIVQYMEASLEGFNGNDGPRGLLSMVSGLCMHERGSAQSIVTLACDHFHGCTISFILLM